MRPVFASAAGLQGCGGRGRGGVLAATLRKYKEMPGFSRSAGAASLRIDRSGLLQFARAAEVGVDPGLPSGTEAPVGCQHVGIEPYRHHTLGFFAERGPAAADNFVALAKNR